MGCVATKRLRPILDLYTQGQVKTKPKAKAEFLHIPGQNVPDEAKILLWDIECTHLKADFGTVLCIGYRWLGEKKVHCPSIMDYPNWKEDMTDDSRLIEDFLKVIAEADIIVTYNGTRFDVPYIKAKMIEHNIGYMPSFKHVDVYQIARHNLAISRRSLEKVAWYIDAKAVKTPVDGRSWKRASTGHAPSIKYVIDHCKADVELLEEVYLKLRPLMKTHPAVRYEIGCCTYCGSGDLVKKKLAWTKSRGFKPEMICKGCNAWNK